MNIPRPFLLALSLSVLSPLGHAAPKGTAIAPQRPVAMVEEIDGAPAVRLEALDYVYQGQRLHLGEKGRAVIVYFDGCRREAIRGGTVTVGAQRSEVVGGQVKPETLSCQPPQVLLTAQLREAGAGVRRAGGEVGGGSEAVDPGITRRREGGRGGEAEAVTLWQVAGNPVFKAPPTLKGKPLTIEVTKADGGAESLVWQGSARGGVVAYPKEAPALVPGQVYRAYLQADDYTETAAFMVYVMPDLDPKTLRPETLHLMVRFGF